MIKYNERLSSAQEQGFTCITFLSLFVQNMLSADVSEVDVSHMHRTPNVTIISATIMCIRNKYSYLYKT